jgi:hypothetical protein
LPPSLALSSVTLLPGFDGLVFDGMHIWVSNQRSNNVTALNASDGSKMGTFTAGTGPQGLGDRPGAPPVGIDSAKARLGWRARPLF